MLVPRKLDDQRFEDIVQEAVGRLPWLCPQWTDHNAHDPGITILELMAWYKEMLQYQMDQLTPALKRGLLALAGVTPEPPRAAVCALEVAPDEPPRPALSRLTNQQEVCLELVEPIPERTLVLAQARVQQQERMTDVPDLLTGGIELRPFSFGGRLGSMLWLGFSGQPSATIRLWFDVTPPQGAPRNPFGEETILPHDLAWEFVDQSEVKPLSDETHALCQSGYICLPVPTGWPEDENGLRWLRIKLTRTGCEEQPRLCGVSDRRYQAVQQQTRARSYRFTVATQEEAQVTLTDAFVRTAELAVFLRTAAGWAQLEQYGDQVDQNGRVLRLDARTAAGDGGDNVLVVGLDPVRVHDLLFDAKGRPSEELYLNLDGQIALPQPFRLLCRTLEPDGVIRPAVWHCVDDLYACGPRDRVFTYDPVRETIRFGNGQYGAVVAAGKGAVLVMDLAVSRCGSGNVPADAGLYFEGDGRTVGNTAASGGFDGESLAELGQRLLRQLQETGKCLSAADYEERARHTPGLRVAAAKALPDYDPQAPAGARGQTMVTVVVLPASEERRPMPDARFLQAVARQLEKYRMIGIRTQVIGPRYTEISVSARLRVTAEADQHQVIETLDGLLSVQHAKIGVPVRCSDIAALLQGVPGVLEVRRLELYGEGQNAYRTQAGDIRIPPDAIAVLRKADVELVSV